VQQKLQRRQLLLTVNNGSLLHQTGWLLNLLQNNGAKKVGMMFAIWLTKNSLRQAYHIAPQRLPLVFFIPYPPSLAVDSAANPSWA
jgi:hypothetical protein